MLTGSISNGRMQLLGSCGCGFESHLSDMVVLSLKDGVTKIDILFGSISNKLLDVDSLSTSLYGCLFPKGGGNLRIKTSAGGVNLLDSRSSCNAG